MQLNSLKLIAVLLFALNSTLSKAESATNTEKISPVKDLVLRDARPKGFEIVKVDPENRKNCAVIKVKWIKLMPVEDMDKWNEQNKGSFAWGKLVQKKTVDCE